jgi:thioredoxin reductase
VTDEADVVIVGGGPAGLAAARTLHDAGVGHVVVLEREREAGGVPRHCGHPTFGVTEFRRPMTGPAYAERLRRDAAGVEIRTSTTVLELQPDGVLRTRSPAGLGKVRGRRVLLATGARETPRAARLVSGSRPWGVFTTGAVQQLVYLNHRRPMRRAVVVGTELVSFSALMTLRHAGVRVVAVVEESTRPTFWQVARAYPALRRTPLLLRTRLVAIEGRDRVEGVVVAGPDGTTRWLDCDGVVFTGRYVPENALLRPSHLELTPGLRAPAVDQAWACSDGTYHAAGNVLRPVETAAWAYREGRAAGLAIARSLGAPEQTHQTVPITWSEPITIVTPQRLRLAGPPVGPLHLKARVSREVRGRLRVTADGREVWSRHVHALPERRISLPRRIGTLAVETLHVEITAR